MDFKREKNNYRNLLFQETRAGGPAYQRAKREHGKLEGWSLSESGDLATVKDKSTSLKSLENMLGYFSRQNIGALSHVTKPSFEIGYHLYGDVSRQPMIGENTNSVRVRVDWEHLDVEVQLYAGIGSKMTQHEAAFAATKNGLRYRQDVSKFTAWNPQTVQTLNDTLMAELEQLIKVSAANQNKFTRLVKGLLVYLYLVDIGSQEVSEHIVDVVVYSPGGVLAEFKKPDQAYIHNSNPLDDQYTVALKLMGEAFPPSFINSHVSVPSDGGRVVQVAVGGSPKTQIRVNLSAEMMLGSVLKYAADVGVTSDLQAALVCACSLKQNRYFSVVALPKVVSHSDLLIKQFVIHDVGASAKAFVTKDMATAIGRVHQMLAFATAKDVITAAECTTKAGFPWEESVRLYLSQQETRIERKGSYFTDLEVLDLAPQMKWLSRMSEDDIADIASISILEALWLCDRTNKVVNDGAIMHMKMGYVSAGGGSDSLQVLKREIVAAQVTLEESKLPTGEFTCEASSIRSGVPRKPRNRSRITAGVTTVFKCDHKPLIGRAVRKSRRRVSTACYLSDSMSDDLPSYSDEMSLGWKESPPEKPDAPTTSDSHSTQVSPIRNLSVSSSPERKKKVGHVQAKLAFEASGFEYEGQGERAAAMANVDTLRRVGDKFQLKEPNAVLEQFSIDEGMSKDEVAVKIYEALKQPGAIAPLGASTYAAGARGLVLSIPQLADEERAFVLDVILKGKVARKMVTVDSSEALEVLTNMKLGQLNVDVIKGNGPQMQRLIDKVQDSRVKSVSSEVTLQAMREHGRNWVGDIATAPREGLPFISNSQSWNDTLTSYGIPLAGKVIGTNVKSGLAQLMSRMEHVNLDDLPHLYKWVENTSVSFMPKDITGAELRKLEPDDVRAFRDKSTSMSKRDYLPGDSKWLSLAIAVDRKTFNYDGLKKLQGQFEMTNRDLALMKKRYW